MFDQTQFKRDVILTVLNALRRRGMPGVEAGKIPAAYTSGNPTIQRGNETASTLGLKTHRVLQPWSNRNGVPVASQLVEVLYDEHDRRVVGGPIVDLSALKVDADYLMGLRPVEPGNTEILSSSAEFSTASTSFVDAKKFQVTRPGKYRIKCELSRDLGVAEARVIRKLRDSSTVVVSGSVTENTATHPTFSATKTIDMTSPSDWGDILYVQLLQQSAGTVYIQNVTVNYADGSAVLAPYDAVL